MVRIVISAIGESDCELIGDGFIAQPVNTVSSLAFVVFGVIVLYSTRRRTGSERTDRLVFAILMILTGLGSVLFHGPQGTGSRFLHDLSLLAVLLYLTAITAGALRGWSRQTQWTVYGISLAVTSAVLLLLPDSTNILAGIAVLALVGTDVFAHREGAVRKRWWFASILVMGLAVVFFVAGRTGSPLCGSTSLFQGHALWHVLSAAALWAYFEATVPARSRDVEGDG